MAKKKSTFVLPEYAEGCSEVVKAEMEKHHIMKEQAEARELAKLEAMRDAEHAEEQLSKAAELRKKYDLSESQAAFVVEYMIDRNAGAAARRAGYSPKSAKSSGHRVLQMPKVIRALAEITNQWLEDSQISREWVLAKLANNINEAEIAGKFNDVNTGLALLMKHLNMFDEIKDDGPQEVAVFVMEDGQEIVY